MQRDCPDCGVTMAETEHKTTYSGDGIRVDTAGGVLGELLQVKGTYVTACVCPECGLVRFYAE